MNFFKSILHYFRKIQIRIVTIFFLLIGASCLFIIYYNYNRSYESIHSISDEMIEQVSDNLIGKIAALTNRTEDIAEVTRGAIGLHGDFAVEIPELVSYLLNLLKSCPTVYSVGIATVDGYYLSAIDLTFSKFNHYYADQEKELPSGCKYATRLINMNCSPSTEDWQYLGTDGSVLATELLKPASYVAQTDPWFTDVKGWPARSWENSILPRGITKYRSLEEPGITYSIPYFKADKSFYALVGVNISLQFLSSYIAHQQIGQSGKAFVLDEEGRLLIPTQKDMDPSFLKLSEELIPAVYQNFQKNADQNFFLTLGSTEYIIYVQEFPISLANDWTIVIAVPFTDFFGGIIKTQHDTIIISFGILLIFSLLIYFFSKRISVPIIQLSREVDKIKHFDFQEQLSLKSKIHEINILDYSIAAMRRALHSFGKYVPKDIVKTLIAQNQTISLGGKKVVLPVMFSDITDFTATSESLTSEQIMSSLSVYFDAISKVILESQGTIDKYIGDSVMAFWGAPHSVADPIKTACMAALRADRICNKESKERGLPEWKTRFGIHVGEVIVGNIGTSERMNYTVIGDVVNTASRLTGINKEYNTSIIISDAVHKNLGEEFVTRPLDFVAVKGKKIKLTIYELMGTREGEFAPTVEQRELCKAFTKAYEVYHAGQVEEGKALFRALSEHFPSDMPTKIILERISSK